MGVTKSTIDLGLSSERKSLAMESTRVIRKDRERRLHKKSLFRFEVATLQNGFVLTRQPRPPPSSQFQSFKMSSIKQLIVNAIIKVSAANPALDREGEPTAEQARDDFIKLLLAELFPEDPAVPVATPKKTKKTKAKKDAVETLVAPAPEAVVAPAVEPAQETAVPTAPEAPAETPSKKKRAPMTEEAKAAMKAKREATLAAKKAAAGQPVSPAPEASVLETSGSNAAAGAGPAPEAAAEPVKEKKPRKPKAEKPAEDANLAKIDPTWRKHLKHADKDHAKELEPELLKFLNALSKDDFNAKKAEEHVADFIASRVTKAAESDGKVEADLIVVDFNGKEYFVNPETKRVYEGEGTCDAEGNWTNYKGVGYVGMAAFADMTIDDE